MNFSPINTYLDKGYEIEVRFDNINSGIFYRVKDHYHLINSVTTTDEYFTNNNKNTKIKVRKTTDADGITKTIQKTNIYSSNFSYSFRLSVSEEKEFQLTDNYKKELTREKKRWTHRSVHSIIELTEVNTIYLNNNTITSWEIELELVEPATIKNLVNDVEILLKVIQNTNVIYNDPLKKDVISDWNTAMGVIGIHNKNGQALMNTDVLVKARNLKRRDLVSGGIDSGYTIAKKADGVSKCLFFNKGGIWLLSPPLEINLLISFNDKYEPYINSCIIGELVPENKRHNIQTPYYFVPYDLLYVPGLKNNVQLYEGNIVKDKYSYLRRISMMKNLITQINPFLNGVVTIENKDILKIGTTPKQLKETYEIVKNKPSNFHTDGYILTPIYASYNPHSDKYPLSQRKLSSYPDVCKIKPWDELTIDFRIVDTDVAKDVCLGKNNQKLTKALYVTDDQSNKNVCFSGDNYFPFYQDINVDWNNPMIANLSGGVIVEFGPVRIGDLIVLQPRRLRNDKQSPNKKNIASDVWTDINSYLEETTITSEDFEKLFQQNNKIKRDIFDKNLEEDTILIDIGSGKGGDLTKWKKASHIYCIEPNQINLAELYNRISYHKMNDKVTVLECGGEDTEFILKNLDITNKNVTVSMMLSLSFFWKNENMLNQLQNTLVSIAKLASNNVKFLYYTIEGNRTLKLFQEKGNDITLGPCHMIYNNPEIYINIKNSIVVDQTEYLVKLLDLTCIKDRTEHPSVIETYLSEDEKTYGNLFVYGVGVIDKQYQNIPLRIKSPPKQLIEEQLTDNYEVVTATTDIGSGQLVRTKTINGNFFHAFLNIVSKEYQSSSNENKFKLVKEFRQTLADYLSLPNNKYKSIDKVIDMLGYNPLEKFPFLPYNSYFSTSKYLSDRDYYIFKKLIMNYHLHLHLGGGGGEDDIDNINDIGFLSEIFEISIVIYSKSGLVRKFTNDFSNKYINIYMLQPQAFESMAQYQNGTMKFILE